MYALNMLAIALELTEHDRTYEDIATKFFEHFLGIAHTLNSLGLWDEDDGFFYDLLLVPGHEAVPLRVRSVVGLVPLFAVETISSSALRRLPDFSARMRWFARHRPALCDSVFSVEESGGAGCGRQMLSVLGQDRLRRVLTRLFDESEFLSPYGVRSMSRHHRADPVSIDLDGAVHRVDYEPAESTTEMFGGNSNWRGPVWFPINFLLVESLPKYHWFLGDESKVTVPDGFDPPPPPGGHRWRAVPAPDRYIPTRPRWPAPGKRRQRPLHFDPASRAGCASPSTSMGIRAPASAPVTRPAGRRLVAKLVTQSGA